MAKTVACERQRPESPSDAPNKPLDERIGIDGARAETAGLSSIIEVIRTVDGGKLPGISTQLSARLVMVD